MCASTSAERMASRTTFGNSFSRAATFAVMSVGSSILRGRCSASRFVVLSRQSPQVIHETSLSALLRAIITHEFLRSVLIVDQIPEETSSTSAYCAVDFSRRFRGGSSKLGRLRFLLFQSLVQGSLRGGNIGSPSSGLLTIVVRIVPCESRYVAQLSNILLCCSNFFLNNLVVTRLTNDFSMRPRDFLFFLAQTARPFTLGLRHSCTGRFFTLRASFLADRFRNIRT